MDMGEFTSKQIGEMMAGGILKAERDLLEEQKSEVPSALKNQNLGHNAKKEGFGPNINQKR